MNESANFINSREGIFTGGHSIAQYYIWQSLAEVDSDMKNYADLGRCYHLSFRDLHKGGCQCSQAMRSRHAHICRENYLSPSVLSGMAL